LEKKDIDVRAKDKYRYTALMLAAEKGHTDTVKELLTHTGIDVNEKGTRTLICAAYSNNPETMKLLLDKGAKVDAENEGGYTALMAAARKGYINITQQLLAARADVNAQSKDGKTALMIAAENGHTDTVSAFLDQEGIDVNAKTTDGKTALMAATYNSHTEIVQKLLEKGAKVDAQDVKGKTALMWAAEKSHKEIVQKLLAARADVNAQSKDGKTALMLAAERDDTEIVELLLQNRATYKLGFFDWFYYNQSIYQQLKQATAPDILGNYSTIQALIASTLMTAVFIALLMLTETPSVALICSLWVLLSASATCYIMQSRGYHFHVYAKDSAKPEGSVDFSLNMQSALQLIEKPEEGHAVRPDNKPPGRPRSKSI